MLIARFLQNGFSIIENGLQYTGSDHGVVVLALLSRPSFVMCSFISSASLGNVFVSSTSPHVFIAFVTPLCKNPSLPKKSEPLFTVVCGTALLLID